MCEDFEICPLRLAQTEDGLKNQCQHLEQLQSVTHLHRTQEQWLPKWGSGPASELALEWGPKRISRYKNEEEEKNKICILYIF